MVLGDEITPAFNNLCVGCPVATLIGDREKTQQGGEDQSAGEEAFQERGKMLARGGIGHGSEGPPQIEIDQDARRDRDGGADEVRDDQILIIRQL